MRGADVRELLAGVTEWVRAAFGRVHPGMLIGAGLAVVALAFGAVGLAILGDDGSGLDDLGLDAPSAPMADGDAASGGSDGGGAGGGDSLSTGLSVREDGGTPARPAAGTLAEPEIGHPAGAPATTESHRASVPDPTTSTTGGSGSSTTAPPSTTTTTAPTTTTEPSSEHPGLIGGLLDILGLGG
jgi:hypothetical protein